MKIYTTAIRGCNMNSTILKLAAFTILAMALCSCTQTVTARTDTFVNPIYEGADPFVYKHTDGFYYFCQSEGDKGIAIWKSDKLADKGYNKTVWIRISLYPKGI